MTHKASHNKTLTNNIPQSSRILKELREIVKEYSVKNNLVPPLQEHEVLYHSSIITKRHKQFSEYKKLLAVMINNYSWEAVVSQIPYNRRILLLPKCLKNSKLCTAKIDELGLLCEQCGNCTISDIITDAEELGYHVIVSEGTTSVMLLLSSGQVECVIGVGCLDSFENSFPLALKKAVPALAVPLYNSDCIDSKLDNAWISEVLYLEDNIGSFKQINLDKIREQMKSWFSFDKLNKLFNTDNKTAEIAVKWLEAGGKRWRPMIMVAAHKALNNKFEEDSDDIIKLAIAVECFHKASLVHDDIADDEHQRYGKTVLHKKYNIPVALNTGDLLMGYGYKLISETSLNTGLKAKLLSVAAQGHEDLCIGQGEELLQRDSSDFVSPDEIINIFSKKTAPAFEVALNFGAVAANADDNLLNILSKYSNALGIAYQIKDDLDDFKQDENVNNFDILSPSLITAVICEKEPENMKLILKKIKNGDKEAVTELFKTAFKNKAVEQARQMLNCYKQQALDVLSELKNSNIKMLLFRLIDKILT